MADSPEEEKKKREIKWIVHHNAKIKKGRHKEDILGKNLVLIFFRYRWEFEIYIKVDTMFERLHRIQYWILFQRMERNVKETK